MIRIIPILPSEVSELAQLGRMTFEAAFAAQNNPEDLKLYLNNAFAKAVLSEQLLNRNCHYFFAKEGAVTVGYLKLNTATAQNELQEDDGLELERIYVVEGQQGKGIGKMLLEFTEKYAQRLDKNYIWLGVWEHNPHAIRLYERAGYRHFDTHIYTIGNDPQTDHLMRKILYNEPTE
jgi:ribosomal protein S18 acetylase RimI-like enzyme